MVTFEEIEIANLVKAFYARVRLDPQLAPIFATKIKAEGWPRHEAHITDFWSSVLRKSARYSGNPMAKHAAVNGLTPELFTHWLALFEDTAKRQLSVRQADVIGKTAQRIAKSLQMGLAFHYDGQGKSDHPFKHFSLRGEEHREN